MIQSKFSKQPIFEYNFHPKFVVKVYQKCNLCCNLHKILNSTTNNNLHGAITGGISTSMYSVYSSLFFLHFYLKTLKVFSIQRQDNVVFQNIEGTFGLYKNHFSLRPILPATVSAHLFVSVSFCGSSTLVTRTMEWAGRGAAALPTNPSDTVQIQARLMATSFSISRPNGGNYHWRSLFVNSAQSTCYDAGGKK